MAFLNATQSSTTNISTERTQDNQANVIIGVVILASSLFGCSLALLALGKDLFVGKTPPVVFVGALVWVDFIGVFSTSVLVFHGLVERAEWLADSPQCSVQAFFTTAFGLSSGAVVTFMSVDRVAALCRPFLYRQYATPRIVRTFCTFLTLFCVILAALPFANVGEYIFNKSSRSFCHFNWFPSDLAGTVFILVIGVNGALLATVMTFCNVVVFSVVVRIKRRMSAVLPSEMNARRHARRAAFRHEERMAKFVALVSVVFLVTWLPVTIRLFCNTFRVNPSLTLDSFSLRLVITNFFLDPFTYVLFKRSFQRKLRCSINELTVFLGEVGRGQKLKKRTIRTERTVKVGNTSGFGVGYFAESSMVKCDHPGPEDLPVVS